MYDLCKLLQCIIVILVQMLSRRDCIQKDNNCMLTYRHIFIYKFGINV